MGAMQANRREFMKSLGMAAGTVGHKHRGAFPAPPGREMRVGMCDWNLGKPCDPEFTSLAREAGLRGIQVSVGTAPDRIPLREKSVRQKYLELGREHGIAFHSVAAGSILNEIPLKSEPQSAVFVIDALEAAAALGAKNILIAFFGNGDLRLQDSMGDLRNLRKEGFASYELDARGVTRTIEVLRQIVPRAADLGVALGIENTLTAEQNAEIIDRIGSPMVQVYYDIGNSTHYGYDIPTELRYLGAGRICEIHVKDWKTPLLGAIEGEVKFDAAAAACRSIGYDKWYVLESSGRKGRFLEDTRTNIDYVRQSFLS